jgi:hypothetical protein
MKHLGRWVFAPALVLALSAMPYARAGGTGGTGTESAGAGAMRITNQIGSGSPDVTDDGNGAGTDVGAVRSSGVIGRPDSDKTNGLNKGTNSGANSDVNQFRGARPYGQ